MKPSFPYRLAVGLLLGSQLLVGCTSLAPLHERPVAPIPGQWPGTAPQPDTEPAALPSAAGTLDWQQFVSDATLRQLIELAQTHNRNLRQTLLNVEAVRAQYRIQRADQLPSVNAQGGVERQRTPADLAGGQSQVQSNYQVGLGLAAFELDLVGRVRNLSEAALQEYLATEEGARAAQISLVAEVIQAYLTRDGALRRHRLTAQTLQTRQASFELIGHRRAAGTATQLDQLEAQGLLEQARAELEAAEREFRQAGNALLLLAGSDDALALLPQQPPPQAAQQALLLVQDVAPGTPSELLVNRPDIRAAERQLRSRNASIGAARAAFFPRISLTGLLGFSSADLGDLFEGRQRSWSFAPQLTLPLFDGGRNRANLDLATLRQDIAVAGYEQTVQTAFREVADALAAVDTLRREEAARQALADTSRRALILSEARYQAGVDDHLRYLDAQRSDFSNQTALIQVATQRQIALATLFRALGGGWSTPADSAAATAQVIR